jgi:hypothetical protein
VLKLLTSTHGGVDMPRGPKGEKRHANPIDNAMLIGRIATGEAKERTDESKDPTAVNSGRLGGLKGGKARSEGSASV